MAENNDLARMKWAMETSKGGSTPLKRIYTTMRQLGSALSYAQVEKIVTEQVKAGEIVTSPHPFHENEYFYSLPDGK